MAAAIIAIAGWIWDGIQALTSAIVAGLVALYGVLAAFASAIWSGAKFFYTDILKPVGLFVDKIYTRAVALYDRFVQPVLRWLDRVTATLRKLYMTVLAPILSTIDGVNRVLQLLSLLHVEWAKKLEDELTALEQKLSLPLQTAIRFLNGIINRVESYVLTAENLFQRVTHLNTLRRDLGAVQNIQWNSLLRNVPKKGSYRVYGPPPPATVDALVISLDGITDFGDKPADPLLAELDDYFDFGVAV